MLCEMCGQEVEGIQRVRVEGSVLRLCGSCARFGTLVDPPPTAAVAPAAAPGRPVVTANRPTGVRRRLEERDLYQEIGELQLADDWGRRVRTAREGRGWTPEDLAKHLNEKKSVVLKLESGSFHPPDELVRKLEHLLRVRLRAEPGAASPA
jgi:putative transcription factor